MPPCSQTLPPESSWANLVRQASARRNLFTRWTTFADNQGESISLREQLTSSGNGEAERFVRSQNPNLDDFGPAAFFRVGSVRHWRERADFDGNGDEIGRASCRERGWVWVREGGVESRIEDALSK